MSRPLGVLSSTKKYFFSITTESYGPRSGSRSSFLLREVGLKEAVLLPVRGEHPVDALVVLVAGHGAVVGVGHHRAAAALEIQFKKPLFLSFDQLGKIYK